MGFVSAYDSVHTMHTYTLLTFILTWYQDRVAFMTRFAYLAIDEIILGCAARRSHPIV